ncbi:hypothetical protein DYI37_09730 [Fulvimarina endophytica]|uniref:Ferric siderophore reductase C-terminal domain-containing protein n=1 Tax=Fulvimarina endophytica TaxID=2293836 RepID=A0A371X2Q0_9HYPH|nr:hypothetical protein [Fulvimarina endophytica]RFC63324.1 hypothetical protein DYI37_09730 [Fulvimarina endophytica]
MEPSREMFEAGRRLGGGVADPSRAAFLDLLQTLAAEPRRRALTRICAMIGETARGPDDLRLADLLRPSAVSRAVLDERRRGAPSRSVAVCQVHRHLARASLGALSALWLLEGSIATAGPGEARFLIEERAIGLRPRAVTPDWRAAAPDEVRAASADLLALLGAIDRTQPRKGGPILASNHAIGLLSPWLALCRAGAPRPAARSAMRTYLAAFAPDCVDAIDWEADRAGFEAGGGGAAITRRACCLKYSSAARSFCGTCPFRTGDPAIA